MSSLARFADEECCDLVTTGRRSGREHRIEIWFGIVDRTVYFISGNGPSADWYRNALAQPSVVVHFGDTTIAGRAYAVNDSDERRRVGELMGAKYPWDGDPSIGLTFEAWCFDVPALGVTIAG